MAFTKRVELPIAKPINIIQKNNINNRQQQQQQNNNNNNNKISNSDFNDDFIDAQIFWSIPQTKIYQISNGKKLLIAQGTLTIVESNQLYANNNRNNKNSTNSTEANYYLALASKWVIALKLDLPVLQLGDRFYTIPTLNGKHWGIVLPESSIENNIDLLTVNAFHSFIQSTTLFKKSHLTLKLDETFIDTPDPIVKHGTTFADKIDKGARYLTNVINISADKLSSVIEEKGDELHSKLNPNEKPLFINDQTKLRIDKAKKASIGAMKISRSLCIGAEATANAISNELSAAFADSEKFKLESSSDQRIQTMKNVAKSSIFAAASISESLLTSGLMLFGNVSSTTAKLVAKKYGNDAGVCAIDVSNITQNMAQAAVSMRSIGVKSIMKHSVQQTIITVLSDDQKLGSIQQTDSQSKITIEDIVS